MNRVGSFGQEGKTAEVKETYALALWTASSDGLFEIDECERSGFVNVRIGCVERLYGNAATGKGKTSG